MAGYVVGVDLGGTKIATGVAAPGSGGKLLARTEAPTRPEEGVAPVLDRIAATVRQVVAEAGIGLAEVAVVSLCCPGPLDVARGVVVFAPNLHWHHVPVNAELERRLGRPVVLENDANAAALAENRFGAGQGTRNMAYVTVSTGIGGGLIIDGRIYQGAHFSAGEIGHTTVIPRGGPKCGCGRFGCLEAVAAGPAIARRAAEAVVEGSALWRLAGGLRERIDARLVAEAARQGDAAAAAVLEETWDYLAIGLANLMNVVDPEAVVIGGGVSRMGELMFQPLQERVRRQAIEGPNAAPVLPAALGTDAGLIGAVAVGLQETGRLG